MRQDGSIVVLLSGKLTTKSQVSLPACRCATQRATPLHASPVWTCTASTGRSSAANTPRTGLSGQAAVLCPSSSRTALRGTTRSTLIQ